MARRRLLTILATSAVLTGTFVGPAAALDLVEDGASTAEVDDATAEVVGAVGAAVEDTVVEEPVAQITETVEEVVAELPVPAPSPSPEAEPERRTAATAPTRDVTGTDDGAEVVAAGAVVDAPRPEVMAAGTGLWSQPDGRSPASPAPMTAPAEPATADVDAPLVAQAPAAAPAAPGMFAQPSTTPLSDEEMPGLALAALVSLLAAGAWTVQEARAGATAMPPTAVTA